MRLLIVTTALIALSACNVSQDDNGVTVQYDENTAENALADASNTAGNIASHIGNDVQETADKVDDRVDVDVDTSGNDASATQNQ